MLNSKRYKNVTQMVRDLSDDPAFTSEFERRLAQRQIVKFLQALRCSGGLSQKDIADRLSCTQSRVSKLESGTDGELRLEDLFGYAEALGLDARILLTKRGQTAVDQVKYHAFSIKRILDQMARMAKGDGAIAKGVVKFIGEAAFNLANMIEGTLKKLCPEATLADPPPIEVQEIEGCQCEEGCEATA